MVALRAQLYFNNILDENKILIYMHGMGAMHEFVYLVLAVTREYNSFERLRNKESLPHHGNRSIRETAKQVLNWKEHQHEWGGGAVG